MKNIKITVTLKLFSGIHRDNGIDDYDMSTGIVMEVTKGTRLRKILRSAGIKHFSGYVFFRNGERIGPWARLMHGDEISCLKPAAGG